MRDVSLIELISSQFGAKRRQTAIPSLERSKLSSAKREASPHQTGHRLEAFFSFLLGGELTREEESIWFPFSQGASCLIEPSLSYSKRKHLFLIILYKSEYYCVTEKWFSLRWISDSKTIIVWEINQTANQARPVLPRGKKDTFTLISKRLS